MGGCTTKTTRVLQGVRAQGFRLEGGRREVGVRKNGTDLSVMSTGAVSRVRERTGISVDTLTSHDTYLYSLLEVFNTRKGKL